APAGGLDRRAEVGLEHHPAAALRRAIPGMVLRRLRGAGAGPAGGPAGGSAGGLAAGVILPVLRVGRADTGPRRDGYLDGLVALAADQRRMGAGFRVRHRPRAGAYVDAGAGVRDHQDLAVLLGGAVGAAVRP